MIVPSLASLALLSSVASASSHRAGRHNAAAKRLSSNAPSSSVARRDGGTDARATFYYTDVGLGACGILHQNSELTVALNSDQYEAWGSSYPSPVCGQTITIQYTDSSGSTTTQEATIQDECPTCPSGGLDLSPGLFKGFADESVGVIYVNWWYGSSSSGSSDTTTTTSEAAATTTSSTEAAWTAATTTSSSEAAWTPTTSSSEAAWTPTTSSSEAAATTSTSAENWNIAAAVVSSESSSSSAAAAATTSSSSDTWVAPSTSSSAEAWVAPATSSTADAWSAPTTTAAWSAAASATADAVLDGETLCPTPPQFVVLANSTVLYNGTVPLFLNESLAASANATLFNASSPYDVADYICFNATLFSIELYESFSANSSTNSTVPAFGLYAANATVIGANSTSTNDTTYLLGTNMTISSAFDAYVATANVSTSIFDGGADNATSHGLVEILDMLAASRSSATAGYLEDSIVDEIDEEDEEDDGLEWCD